jgi:hypothetical protein
MLPIWQRLQKVDQVPGLWSVRQLAGLAGLAARRVGVAHANATAAASVAPQVAAAGVPALAAPKEVAPQVAGAGAGAGVGVPAPAAHQVAPTALRVPASKMLMQSILQPFCWSLSPNSNRFVGVYSNSL